MGKLAIATVACRRDEGCVAPHLRMLRQTYPDAVLGLSVDGGDMSGGRRGYDLREAHTWAGEGGRGLAREMLQLLTRLAEKTGAEWVMKTDVDAVHLSDRWLEELGPDYDMVGLQNADEAWYCYGLAYVIRSSALPSLIGQLDRVEDDEFAEDRAVSTCARFAFPDRIFMHPAFTDDRLHCGLPEGWAEKTQEERVAFLPRFLDAALVHCGQYVARSDIGAAMELVGVVILIWTRSPLPLQL